MEKEDVRRRIWKLLEESEVTRFPRPVVGRIPNFIGAGKAAENMADLLEFKRAKTVKVNPDSPQTKVRQLTLLTGKMLLMPSPQLRKGFILLDPKTIPKKAFKEASTIKGAFKYGRLYSINKLPKIDLIVAGSVAVSTNGIRIGKGEGYSEIEYGILRELGLIREETPIFTTVHDIQIVDEAPKNYYDFVVDAIITPTKVIRIKRKNPQPKGIIWKILSPDKIKKIPVLSELKTSKLE